jgi:hypothetical protein
VSFRIFNTLIAVLSLFLFLSCGGDENERTLRFQIVLPADWESLIDMEVLGSPLSTPYVGTIRIIVEDGTDVSTWEFPWDDKAGSTGNLSLTESSVLRVEAVTAGTVIMERDLPAVGDSEVTITLKESGGFAAAGSLLHYRQDHSAVAVGDTVMIIGGTLSTRVIEEIASSGDEFAVSAYAASLVYPRTGQEVLHDEAGGRLFVFKGATPTVEDNLYEVVDINSDLIAPIALSNYRFDFTSLIDSQIIYLFGGKDNVPNWQDNTLLIDAQDLSEYIWTTMGSALVRKEPLCVIQSAKIACFGGSTDVIEVFDIATGKLENSVSNFPIMNYFSVVHLQNGEIVINGGLEGVIAKNYAKKFNVLTGELNDLNFELLYSRYYHSATYIAANKILILGGGPTTESSRSAEILDLTTGQSTELPWRMRVSRVGHSATLLPDGRVLVVGGNMGDRTVEVWNPPAWIAN